MGAVDFIRPLPVLYSFTEFMLNDIVDQRLHTPCNPFIFMMFIL